MYGGCPFQVSSLTTGKSFSGTFSDRNSHSRQCVRYVDRGCLAPFATSARDPNHLPRNLLEIYPQRPSEGAISSFRFKLLGCVNPLLSLLITATLHLLMFLSMRPFNSSTDSSRCTGLSRSASSTGVVCFLSTCFLSPLNRTALEHIWGGCCSAQKKK